MTRTILSVLGALFLLTASSCTGSAPDHFAAPTLVSAPRVVAGPLATQANEWATATIFRITNHENTPLVVPFHVNAPQDDAQTRAAPSDTRRMIVPAHATRLLVYQHETRNAPETGAPTAASIAFDTPERLDRKVPLDQALWEIHDAKAMCLQGTGECHMRTTVTWHGDEEALITHAYFVAYLSSTRDEQTTRALVGAGTMPFRRGNTVHDSGDSITFSSTIIGVDEKHKDQADRFEFEFYITATYPDKSS